MIPPPPPPIRNRQGKESSAPQSSMSSQSGTTYGGSQNGNEVNGHVAPPVMYTPEPYGAVSTSSVPSAPSGMSHRRPVPTMMQSDYAYGSASTGSTQSPYTMPPSSYGTPAPQQHASPKLSSKKGGGSNDANPQYQHNASSLSFLLPTFLSILWWHDSPTVLHILFALGLILYGVDLINARDTLAVMYWASAVIFSSVNALATLLQVDDSEAHGGAMILYLLRLSTEGLFFCTMACWSNLQFRWLWKEVPSIARSMEQAVHGFLPPICSSILCYHIVRLLMDYWGVDRVAILAPLLFAMFMTVTMTTVGNAESSFPATPDDNGKFAVSSHVARLHSMVLLMVPGTMHFFIYRHRVFSRYAGMEEIYDVILVWAIPYLLHFGLVYLSHEKTPYEMHNSLFPKAGDSTIRGVIIPVVVTVLASLAAQQHYLIPLCNALSYQFNGHDHASTWLISSYLTITTLCACSALWIWGRKSSVTNEPLFGEYHDDVVQLLVSVSGLLLGKAVGLPWNLTPLPVLAFLGLSVWMTTRMLRYLAIFLFVIHSAGVVLFNYRFASIDLEVPLAILPGTHVGLVRLGMIEVGASVLFGLVVGFAARPPGGVGASLLKKIDAPGITFIAYSFILSTSELTLLGQIGQPETGGSDTGLEDSGAPYNHATAVVTSVVVAMVGAYLFRFKVASKASIFLAISIALGQCFAVIADAVEMNGRSRNQERILRKLFLRYISAAMLIAVVLLPRAILTPTYIKTSASTKYKRSLADGRAIGGVPTSTELKICVYALLILPVTLVAAGPFVLAPLAKTFSVHYGGGAYYSSTPPVIETLGASLCVWGVATLSMLTHYLPDGGGERWKKTSALSLLMGVGLVFAAPNVPSWITGDDGFGVSNPYASVSSLGTQLATSGRNRTGGWGLLAATLATLLAITGPLELKERKHPSGRKDKSLLLRLMVFGLLFGGGVAWFITVLTMSAQDYILVLVMVAVGCMSVSFFGTVTAVLGYFLELESFDEVYQMATGFAAVLALFLVLLGIPQFVAPTGTIRAFGPGGWLFTYLVVASICFFAISMVLRMRRSKDSRSRGLGNLCCVCSYISATAVLYGQYGVAGLDQSFNVASFAGFPSSVVGTLILSLILLALEGESSTDRRSRVSRISATNSKSTSNEIGLTLQNLNNTNAFAPLIMGILGTYFLAALYAILVRGSFLSGPVATSHIDVLSTVLGSEGESRLAAMAKQSTFHSQALRISARMAGSGIWTSSNFFSPILHLIGLAAALPSGLLLLQESWFCQKVPRSQVLISLPLNGVPVLFCRGLPPLFAAALIGAGGGAVQLLKMQQSSRKSHMRI